MTTEDSIRDQVRQGYAAIAQGGGSCCGSEQTCGGGANDAGQLAQAIGYTQQELAELPESANMGLSCGNPVALAALNAGEVVVDPWQWRRVRRIHRRP